MAGTTITMHKLPKGTTMNVTLHLSKRLLWRIKIATMLFRLAGWVPDCRVEVEEGAHADSV